MRRSIAIPALLLWLSACGGRDEGSAGPSADSPPQGSAPRATPATELAAADWQDPEPPGAQALAESVLAAGWNQHKTLSLTMDHTLPLTMTITTLVDRRSGIQGFATALASKEASLDDRLSKLGAEMTGTEVVIRLPGSVLFDFDSATIRADAERTLTEVASVLAAYGKRAVRVEGHTDSIASDAYNQKLSEQRAGAVVRWLAAHGVASGRMQSRGFGEAKPVADNATAGGRQLNRRVEIVIEKV